MSDRFDQLRTPPRSLAGATILQIVPALREEPSARAAIDLAHTLLQAGARALVAGRDGPLVDELKSYGGEWVSLASETMNPLTARRNVGAIESLISAEHVDIVHAQCAGGATAAQKAVSNVPARLVATLADVPPRSARDLARMRALTQADRIIAPSTYAATPAIERYGLPREQITIIPRAIDTAMFDPASVHPERVNALRRTWRLPPGHRVVMTPGRVAPWNGQALLPEVARAIVDSGFADVVFAVVGENRSHRRYARSVLQRAKQLEVEALFRITGHVPDMPAAFAATDIVMIPAIEPPVLGRAVAQAQAMGRPVVTTAIGALPELVVVPPFLPEDVRTGWLAAAGDPNDLARALELALTLDEPAYRAMSARARQFAEYMFSPEAVAAATRAVYTALLAREL